MAVLRDEGPRIFWFKLLGTLGWYRRLILLERPLAQAVPDFAARLPIHIDELHESERDAYAAFRAGAEPARLAARFRSGNQCFVVRHQGRIVSACWAARGRVRVEFLECDIQAAAGEVYFFDAFTLPSYRGMGIAPALCLHQLRYFREAGLDRAVRATAPENEPALRAHAKSGFRPYAVIGRLKIGPWRRVFHRPCNGSALDR